MADEISSFLETIIKDRFEIVRDHLMLAMGAALLLNIPVIKIMTKGLLPSSDPPSALPTPHSRHTPIGQARVEQEPKLWTAWHWIQNDPKLFSLALFFFMSGATAVLPQFLFYWIISEQVKSTTGFVGFFSTFYIWLNSISLFMLVFGSERIIHRFGLLFALLALPVTLLLGSAYLFFFTLVGAIYVLKIIEETMDETIHEPAIEELFLKLNQSQVPLLRPFLGAFVNRLGKGVMAIFVLLLTLVFHIPMRGMILFLIFSYLLWAITIVALKRSESSASPEPS